MNYTYLHYQTALTLLCGVGPRRSRALLQHLGSIETLFEASYRELSEITGLKVSFFQKMERSKALEEAEKILAFHEAKNIQSIFYTDSKFSRRLNQCTDAPTQLFLKGDVDLNSSRFVAIVGTRMATDYGKRICRDLISSFKDRNIVVVSGLAAGIDTYVHRYCIEYGIPTIGVLGHGLDRIYPAGNRALAAKMIDSGGLVTEFTPGTNPDRENFPRRNRIVAGLCDATIVVESKATGGSLITAQIANSYNRDVFAFPGSIYMETSLGCNMLIATSRAQLLESPNEFLKSMQWEELTNTKGETQLNCFPELSELQQEIAGEIRQNPHIQLDVLAAKLALPVSSLQVELLQLRLSGIVEEVAGKRYQLA